MLNVLSGLSKELDKIIKSPFSEGDKCGDTYLYFPLSSPTIRKNKLGETGEGKNEVE